MSTGLPAFDGDSTGGDGSGLNWVSTVIPDGPGINGLPVFLGGDTFQLPNLPRLDDGGQLLTSGFLADLGFITIPAGEGSENPNLVAPPVDFNTIGHGIDSPDPVTGEIEEAPSG
jgi:hypothetical protein